MTTGAAPCGLCGGAVEPLVRFDAIAVGRCRRCGSAPVTASSAADHDPEAYSRSYEEERVEAKARACWTLLREQLAGHPTVGSVTDLGCGEGAFLDLARTGGLRTRGLEIAERAAAVARAVGHHVLSGSLLGGPLPDSLRSDVVVMWDVLEHLEHPGEALRNARDLLPPGGHLLLATPMMGSVYDRAGIALHRWTRGRSAALLRLCWSDEHVIRLSAGGLEAEMRRLGFASVSVRPLLLLSLRPTVYAGGRILPAWTRSAHLNRMVSRLGVWSARTFGWHNKLLVHAVR